MRLAEATGNRRLIAMYVPLVDELRRVGGVVPPAAWFLH
jgi:hypothetical protein